VPALVVTARRNPPSLSNNSTRAATRRPSSSSTRRWTVAAAGFTEASGEMFLVPPVYRMVTLTAGTEWSSGFHTNGKWSGVAPHMLAQIA
jgi:hypothetical protein